MSWLKKVFGRSGTAEGTSKSSVDGGQGSVSSGEEPPIMAADIYRIFPPRSSNQIPRWAKAFPDFREIVGYSVLGHFFLRNPDTQEYIVLHPFKGAAKSYGVHPSLNDFERNVLAEAGFIQFVLRPDHVSIIRRLLGALEDDEIYIPQPYPFLGGTEAPETYSRGNVWVFMDIVAQMGGLDA